MSDTLALIIMLAPLALIVTFWYEVGKKTGSGEREDKFLTFWTGAVMGLGGLYVTQFVPWILGMVEGGV